MAKRREKMSEGKQNIIAMNAQGLTTRYILHQIEDIYGFEVSEGLVSKITDKLDIKAIYITF